MNILIDAALVAIVCLALLYTTRKTTVSALISFGLALASVLASWGLSIPAAQLAARWVEPAYAQAAAGQIASMVGVPALDNGYDTMTAVTPEQLWGLGEDLERLAGQYNVPVTYLKQAARGLPGPEGSQAVLTALIRPVSLAVTGAVLRLILFFLLYWLLRILVKAVFGARLTAKPLRKNQAVNALLGLALGVLLSSYVFLPFLAAAAPYEAGFLSLLSIRASCEKSVLYGIFAWFNPFL